MSCSRDVIPTGVTLNQTSLSLKIGDTFALTATVSPSNADNQNVKWTSLDANVASVSSGLVSAISPGETSIIATTEAGNLTQAPELPATDHTFNCYRSMFSGCTKLNHVKALFTTRPSSSYKAIWLSGVATNGTFIKNASVTWDADITRGEDTVPEGWTITNGDVAN